MVLFSGFVIPNVASAGRTERLLRMQVECSTWDAERLCEEPQVKSHQSLAAGEFAGSRKQQPTRLPRRGERLRVREPLQPGSQIGR